MTLLWENILTSAASTMAKTICAAMTNLPYV